MSPIRFLVDRVHVGTTNSELIRDLYRRMRRVRQAFPAAWSREVRKEAYREALQRHCENRDTYQAVQQGAGFKGVTHE